MLKPTANYKMSKELKTSLALGNFKNDHDRSSWKRAMIQAELSASIQPKREKTRRDTKENS
jgi:hypothetical protein